MLDKLRHFFLHRLHACIYDHEATLTRMQICLHLLQMHLHQVQLVSLVSVLSEHLVVGYSVGYSLSAITVDEMVAPDEYAPMIADTFSFEIIRIVSVFASSGDEEFP